MMECKNCKRICVRNGKHRSGVQKYYCKNCGLNQQNTYVYKGCETGIMENIEKLTIEGCGIRSISRLLSISLGKVISSVKHLYRKKLKDKRTILIGLEYELDEMRTYIGSKQKKYWIVYAIDIATKEVVDFKVGRRNNRTLKRVVDTLLLSRARKIYTDGLKNYKTLIPEEIHKVGKYKNNKIERNNLSVRTHLKRLSRRTICFSKSISMLESVLGIYFWRNVYIGSNYKLQ